MRIQEGHFLKVASNLDLTLPDDGECLALLISSGIIQSAYAHSAGPLLGHVGMKLLDPFGRPPI